MDNAAVAEKTAKEAPKVERENAAARDAAYAQALKRELEGYERAGNTARADLVKAELRRLGKAAKETTATSGGPERTVQPPPAVKPPAAKKRTAKKG